MSCDFHRMYYTLYMYIYAVYMYIYAVYMYLFLEHFILQWSILREEEMMPSPPLPFLTLTMLLLRTSWRRGLILQRNSLMRLPYWSQATPSPFLLLLLPVDTLRNQPTIHYSIHWTLY